jgi:AraC-like DNA-binding protein
VQGPTKKSELRFVSKLNSDPVPALAHAQISASSEGLGWKGLYLEVGTNFGCDVDELMVDGHFVGLQLNDEPILISTRANAGSWVETVMPPRTLWLHPEGTPFSIRHALRSYWAGAVIDGPFLDSVLGCHHELRPSYVVRDEVLSHALLAVIELLRQEHESGPGDPEVAAAMIRSFVLALGKRHGAPAPPIPTGGSIAEHQLKALLAWIERNLGRALTVDAMAQRVGLSVAHFSREFKRSMGATPWAYVMERRLQLAHEQLRMGSPVACVAHDCGFADQSHLSRAIRARYGVAPSGILGKAAR